MAVSPSQTGGSSCSGVPSRSSCVDALRARLVEAVGAGKVAVEIVERAVLREDHHHVLDLVDAARRLRAGAPAAGGRPPAVPSAVEPATCKRVMVTTSRCDVRHDAAGRRPSGIAERCALRGYACRRVAARSRLVRPGRSLGRCGGTAQGRCATARGSLASGRARRRSLALAARAGGRAGRADEPARRCASRRGASRRRSARKLFLDPRLSPSGQVACASCHSPEHAFGPPNALPVQLGGGDLRQPGLRAVPSMRYLQAVPPFTEHFFESEDEADESVDNGADRRPDLGRPRRPRPRPGAHPAALAFEMANAEPRRRWSRSVLARRLRPGPRRDLRRRGASTTASAAYDAILKALRGLRAGLARPSTPTPASTTPTSPARRRSRRPRRAASSCSRPRTRATAPPATSASPAPTARRRSSPTTA